MIGSVGAGSRHRCVVRSERAHAVVSVQEPVADTAPPAADAPARGDWWWVPGAITVVTIVSVILVIL